MPSRNGASRPSSQSGRGILPRLGLLPGVAVAEGEQDGHARISLTERGHDLAASPAGLGGVLGPGFGRGVALLVVLEELALILLGVEENPPAMAFAGDPRGDPGVGQDRGEVVEPVEVGRRGVEPEEVVREPLEAGRFQVVDRGLQLLDRERPTPPAVPGEVDELAVLLDDIRMEDAAVKRRGLHLPDVPAEERGVGLVPAELDQFLLRRLRRRSRSSGIR